MRKGTASRLLNPPPRRSQRRRVLAGSCAPIDWAAAWARRDTHPCDLPTEYQNPLCSPRPTAPTCVFDFGMAARRNGRAPTAAAAAAELLEAMSMIAYAKQQDHPLRDAAQGGGAGAHVLAARRQRHRAPGDARCLLVGTEAKTLFTRPGRARAVLRAAQRRPCVRARWRPAAAGQRRRRATAAGAAAAAAALVQAALRVCG